MLESLDALGAPLTVVAGNTDDPSPRLPLEARITLGGVRILVRHILPQPARLSARAVAEISADGTRVVVSGHSHRPHTEERGGVLFLNPGSAGQPRFGLPHSLGYLWLDESVATPPRFELVTFRPGSA